MLLLEFSKGSLIKGLRTANRIVVKILKIKGGANLLLVKVSLDASKEI